MIRIGLLGASRIAPKGIIQPAQPRQDCVIQAVAARDENRARDYAVEHNIPHYETSYEALIARDDIDLIYNALPPNRHADLSILAAQHGKAVLCEKPFALNGDEAACMVAAAEAAGTVLIEAFHYRYHPSFLKFEEIIRSGRIGEIEVISGVFDVHIPNRAGELRYLPELGGGALMDLGCYPLHAMRTLLKTEPTILATDHDMKETGRAETGVAVATSAEMSFGSTKAFLDTNMDRDAVFDNSLHVIGTTGVASLRNFVHPYRWDPHTGFEIYVEVDGAREVITLLNAPEAWKRTTYQYQLDHVIAVMQGQAKPLTGGADAVANMHAIDAIMAH